MSKLNLVDNMYLEPQVAVDVPIANSGGQKSLIQTYPIENGPWGVNYSGTQQTATFDISSKSAAWDPVESYFTCQVLAGTTFHCPGDINAMIARVQIQTIGGTPIVDTQNGHNLWGRIVDICTVNPGVNSTPVPSNAQMNWQSNKQSLLQPDAYQYEFNTVATEVSFKLAIPFLQQIRAFPLPVSGSIRIILTFAQDQLVSSVGATGTYKCQNLVYNTVFKPYNPAALKKIMVVANEVGIVIPYTQVVYQAQNLSSSTANLQLNLAFKWCKAMVAVVRNNAHFASYGYDNLSQYLVPPGGSAPKYGIVSFQMQQGSNLFPAQPITNPTAQYMELQKVMKVYEDRDACNGITRSRFLTASYQSSTDQSSQCPLNVLAIDMGSDEGSFFTGVSTLNGTFILNYNTASAPAANSQIDIFMIADYALTIFNEAYSSVEG